MNLYFLISAATALLLFIWSVCRTPDGPARDAETRRATQLADKNSAQAQFGGDASVGPGAHHFNPPPSSEQ